MREEREWELGVLASILKNPQYLRKYSDVLLERHINYPLGPKYWRLFKLAYKAHGRLPTVTEMKYLTKQLCTKEQQPSEVTKEMLKDVDEIYSMEVSDITREYIEQFICERSMSVVQEKIGMADWAKRQEFFAEIVNNVNGLARMGGGIQAEGCYLLDPDMIDSTVDAIQNISMYGYRTTGITRLDGLIGGFGPGEFSVFAGPTGRGKTALLVNVGAANVEVGERVLHVSMDEPEMQIRQRYLTRLSRIPKKAAASKEHHHQQLAHLRACSKNLLILSKPNETITTLDIQNYIEMKSEELYYHDRKHGLFPGREGRFSMIITDYATKTKGWMSRSKVGDQSWDRIRYCSEEHQHLARSTYEAEGGIPVVSAFQGNKEMAMNEIGQLTQIAMGYSGNQALTNCLIIGQLNDDLHKDPSRLWLYGGKTRTEESLFLVPVCYEKQRQLVWDDLETDVDYIDSTTSKRAGPKNYRSHQKQEERAREGAQQRQNENPDYRPDDEAWDANSEYHREWRTRNFSSTLEEEGDPDNGNGTAESDSDSRKEPLPT